MKEFIKIWLCVICFGMVCNISNAQDNEVAEISLPNCTIVNRSLAQYIKERFTPVILDQAKQLGNYYLYITCDKQYNNKFKVRVICHQIDALSTILYDREELITEYKYRYYTIVSGLTFEIFSDLSNYFVKTENGEEKTVKYSTIPKTPVIDDAYYEVVFDFEGEELLNCEILNFLGLVEYRW